MLTHEEQSGRFLLRPQQDYPAATVADFCTAVLSLEIGIEAHGHEGGPIEGITQGFSPAAE